MALPDRVMAIRDRRRGGGPPAASRRRRLNANAVTDTISASTASAYQRRLRWVRTVMERTRSRRKMTMTVTRTTTTDRRAALRQRGPFPPPGLVSAAAVVAVF